MAKAYATERADLAYADLTPEEVHEVRAEFALTFTRGWERRFFFTKWSDGTWSACATRPLFAKK